MLVNECPWMVCSVGFEAMVWRPAIGMKLSGKFSLSSPDHISLLVHRTFNVSIPRHHIETDQFEFHYGPLENDPEFGPNAPSKQDGETQSTGRWVHKITSDPLGGEDGQLEFTVIGLTVANEMLSLVGSLQAKPFDPSHVPTSSQPAEEDDLESVIQDLSQHASRDDESIEEDQDDGINVEDTFAILGRGSDQMKAKANAAKSSVKRKPQQELDSPKKKKKKSDDNGKKKKRKKQATEENDG